MLRPFDDKATTLIFDSARSGDQLKSPMREISFDWDKICDLVRNPLIADTLHGFNDDPNDPKKFRDCIPLWAFYNTQKHFKKFWNDGTPSPCTENMYALHALIIDVDNGMTIDAFIDQWKLYTFILYTSPSYDGVFDKYRIIMPLDGGYNPEMFRPLSVKSAILTYFSGCDKSTVDSFRKQRVPGIKHADSPYRYHINSGQLFSIPQDILDIYENEPEYDECPDIFNKPINQLVPKSEDSQEGIFNHVDEILSDLDFSVKGAGIVNASLLRANAFMEHAGIPSHIRRNTLYQYTSDRERRSSIDRMTKK